MIKINPKIDLERIFWVIVLHTLVVIKASTNFPMEKFQLEIQVLKFFRFARNLSDITFSEKMKFHLFLTT